MRARALPRPLHVMSEGIAFLVELAALGALAWWGTDTGPGLGGATLLGAGAPAAAAIGWGLFAAPRARIRLPMAGILTVNAVAFGGGRRGLRPGTARAGYRLCRGSAGQHGGRSCRPQR